MGNACVSSGDTTSKVPAGTDYIITVKTGDKKGAGTNSNVFMCLINENGEKSRDIPLDCRWNNDFESGKKDMFPVLNLPNFGLIRAIEIWRDDRMIDDDWFVEFIIVEKNDSQEEFFFPLNRWVKANKRLKIKENDCQLPQEDEEIQNRKIELLEKRESYQFVVNSPGLPPQVKECPRDESFSNDYKWDIIKMKASLFLTTKLKDITTDQWETLSGVSTLYCDALPRPVGMDNWDKDIEFGFQRLSGCNPTQLRLCKEIPENFAVTYDMLRALMDGVTISEAIEDKRLYIVDYTFMKDLECTDGRKIAAPYALFFVNEMKELTPIAIQLFPDPGPDNPVFLPTDPEYTWILAKMWFNNCDANYHQSCTHLAFTHLVMETIAVAVHRSLSPSHPIFRLLAPHFIYLLAINSRALALLVCEGGWVDKCLTVGRVGMFNLIKMEMQKWRMDVQGNLPKDLEERGVENADALPNYYYRDDALLLWDAIKEYVMDVVIGHYDTPEKMARDEELQDFARTLTASPEEGGCGLMGVPGGGKFEYAEDLQNALTSMIFVSSAGHAAANFCQYDEYGFPPNYPALLFNGPPTDKEARTETDIVNALADKDMTLNVLLVTRLLSERGTKPLGDFEVQYTFDPIGTKALDNFRSKLKEVGSIISNRNKTRRTPYVYLHPSEIPNAISI
ncbi:Arachidonate 5-lipoxygenase [Holothuria leucospilota]|uniref:Arachidonate 5-lipoxygenase n=1 Tax=Holothuria leucospilota TaxID=206669 RepID=A0A9Q1CIQ2_HOLLE|nr:Arachidonate 5-lipoxygenase [Holothuria leucospilota]